MMNHLRSHHILMDFQNGLRSNPSDETFLLNTVEDMPRRLDEQYTNDLLILYFSKASDTLTHRRMHHQIQHYSITGNNQHVLVQVMAVLPSAETCS